MRSFPPKSLIESDVFQTLSETKRVSPAISPAIFGAMSILKDFLDPHRRRPLRAEDLSDYEAAETWFF